MPSGRGIAAVLVALVWMVGVDAGVTSNAMPTWSAGCNTAGDCPQGMFVADAFRSQAADGGSVANIIAYANGQSIKAGTWPAHTEITADVVNNQLFPYDNTVCTMKLRGASILKLLDMSVSSANMAPGTGATFTAVLQIAGVRVTYSDALQASSRMTGVELENGSGGWNEIDRTALYTVAATDFDIQNKYPYNTITSSPTLDGETAAECTLGSVQDAVVASVETRSPLTIDVNAGTRNIRKSIGAPLLIDYSAVVCLARVPSLIYDPNMDSCIKCPLNEITTDGVSCKSGGSGPVAGPQTTNPMPSGLNVDGTKKCTKGDCAQGFLVTDAMRLAFKDDFAQIAFVNGGSLGGPGWIAGSVGNKEYHDIIPYTNVACKQKLLGASIIALFAKCVASVSLPGVSSGEFHAPLQISGARIEYNSALPPENRLLSIEIMNADGSYTPIHRLKYYTVVSTDYVMKHLSPYKELLDLQLLGESAHECGVDVVQDVISKYVAANSPLTLDITTGSRIQKMTSGTPMIVDETPASCKVKISPSVYVDSLRSCLRCPPGTISDGRACSANNKTGMATTNAMLPTAGEMCERGDCGQGMLMSDALRLKAGTDVAYVGASRLRGNGWPAGSVSEIDAKGIFPFGSVLCTMTVRGATLLRLANSSISSRLLPGAPGTSNLHLLQLSGLRITYSTTLPADARLLKVEVLTSGSWADVDRVRLYTVAATELDFRDEVPYNKFTKEPQLKEETQYVCSTDNPPDAIVEFLKANMPWTVPGSFIRTMGQSGGTALVVELNPSICLTDSVTHYYAADIAACAPCPVGKESTGVGCVEPGSRDLAVKAEKLIVATTHAPLLSGGLHGCRKTEGGLDLANHMCTDGLVEAVMNLRNFVSPNPPSQTSPAPLFLPTADFADEMMSMHKDRWAVQCSIFERFQASAFQVYRVGLTHAQKSAAVPWQCSANLLLGNADFDPPRFWFNNAQKLLVDKSTGLGVTTVVDSTDTRGEELVSSIAVAAEVAESDPSVKAFIVLVQNGDPMAIAEELQKQMIFATAIVATTMHLDPVKIGEIWVGGKSAISNSNKKRLAVTTLVGPFTPYTPKAGVAASLVRATGLLLSHYNPASSADRLADSKWLADQEFMQSTINAAVAHNPTLAHSENPVPHSERNRAVSVCMQGECMQGRLIADAVLHAIGGVGIALVGSSAIGGPGWAVGPIKVSNVYDMHEHPNFICSQQLRGETLVKIFGEMLLSQNLPGLSNGTKNVDTFQLAGARVTYSTVLSATSRLLKVETKDEVEGGWVGLDRTELYTVGGADYDILKKTPFNQWTASPELAGETVPVCGDQVMQDIIGEYISAHEPYTVPIDVRLLGTDGTEPIPIEESARLCLAMQPPKIYDDHLAACRLCPAGRIPGSTGLECAPTGQNQPHNSGGATADNGGSGSKKLITIIVGVAGGALALLIVIIVGILCVRRKAPSAVTDPLMESRLDPASEFVELKETERPITDHSHAASTPLVSDQPISVPANVGEPPDVDEDL